MSATCPPVSFKSICLGITIWCWQTWVMQFKGCGVMSPWASCQIRIIAGCACAEMPGTFSPSPRVSDPDMHHDTCVTHMPWCMPGSLTSGFLWSRLQGKRSRYSRCMRNPQFYVSGKRPMDGCTFNCVFDGGCYRFSSLVKFHNKDLSRVSLFRQDTSAYYQLIISTSGGTFCRIKCKGSDWHISQFFIW